MNTYTATRHNLDPVWLRTWPSVSQASAHARRKRDASSSYDCHRTGNVDNTNSNNNMTINHNHNHKHNNSNKHNNDNNNTKRLPVKPVAPKMAMSYFRSPVGRAALPLFVFSESDTRGAELQNKVTKLGQVHRERITSKGTLPLGVKPAIRSWEDTG